MMVNCGMMLLAAVAVTSVPGEAPSLLPEGKKFNLVWHDEFNGDKLDTTKWCYRTNFWGRRFAAFAAPEDNAVEVKDGKVHLKVLKLPNGQFVSPQLQTGGLIWDIPHLQDRKGLWPLPKREKPLFEHRYGYYECRFRLQRKPGWWSAFWMQSVNNGTTLDPARSGIEHDIMEAFEPGEIRGQCFHYNGYGADYRGFNIPRGTSWTDPKAVVKVGSDDFHTIGMLWEPDGYTVYLDGVPRGEKVGSVGKEAVSHVPEFLLLTTECKWYRNDCMTGKGVPELEAAVAAGDDFVADFVRVYDVVSTGGETVPEAYRRLWNDEVNAGIDARIERYRKADARVDGFPAAAEVSVEQLTHEFRFGSHIFNFDQLGRDDWNAQYRATFTNLWNAATVSFYWDKMETKEGEIRYAAGPRDSAGFWKSVKDLSAKDKLEKFPEYRRPAPDPVLDFLDANGISAHGHLMVYPVFPPAWATNGADKATLAARYERRIRQLGEHYGARLDQWDVVNESVDRSCSMAGPFHDKVVWNRPNVLVPDDYTFRCHKWAEAAFPSAVKFEMNDSWRPIYVPFVQSIIDRGAKVDVVGVQMHIFQAEHARKIAAGEPCISNNTDWTPEAQFQMLRALDTLKRPIHISEITIPAPDDTAAGEDAQARLIRDNYRLWFSWPSVYRITYWNLVDHTYHKENLASGLYTVDMRKKKAYQALDRLINREWKTRLTAKADAGGTLAFRGFRGRYRLTWKGANGKTLSREVDVK